MERGDADLIDRRAVECARRNVSDPRASFHWADIADGEPTLSGLDFVVMNPPFHGEGKVSPDAGRARLQAFRRR